MMNPSSVAAVFLFNHRFERNIATLDAIYAERFPIRTYLMPFARSVRGDVARVFETSWHFSGHVAQGAKTFIRPDVTHYVFISDDLIVNPALGADTIVAGLGLDADTGYIKSVASIDATRFRWHRAIETVIAMNRNGAGFDYKAELPSVEEALARYARLGVHVPDRPLPRSASELRFMLQHVPARAGWLSMPWLLRTLGQRTPYPLVGGYADFFVVPATAIEAFVHYCGVFAALDIFAEVAIPTALALSTERVVTELEPGETFEEPGARRRDAAAWRGTEFWRPGDADAFGKRYGFERDRLLREFPANWLYVHPVKLSRWR